MEQKILGIDIGSHSLKMCELTRSFREFELINFYEQVISTSNRLTHEEAVAAGLRSMVEKNKIEADVVSVTLPGNLVSCRVLQLPFTNIKKIDQTIEFELESYLPVSLDELLIDYSILSIDEHRSTILVAYTPKSRFIKYLDMLQLAGIDPKFIGVDVIDMASISQIAMVAQDTNYAIIDVGYSKTNVTVMEGRKLKYARTITLGGIHFTKAIQKAFKLNQDKAEALKLDRGRVSLDGKDLDQISRLCQKVAEELIVALRQTYLGFRQIYKNEQWHGLYLLGGGARLQGLPDLIAQAMRLNVSSLDCIDFIPNKLSQPEMVKDVVAPCLSQTLKVIFSNKAIKINFRRGEFSYKKDIKAIGSEIKQLGVWFSIVFLLGVAHFAYSYHTLDQRIAKVNEDFVNATVKALPEFKKTGKKGSEQSAKKLLSSINSKIAEIKPQLDAFQAGSSGASPLQVLKEISTVIPKKEDIVIDIDDFSYSGDVVTLQGRTNSFEAVDILKGSLEKSTLLKNITTRNVAKAIRDEIKFTMSLDLGNEEGGDS